MAENNVIKFAGYCQRARIVILRALTLPLMLALVALLTLPIYSCTNMPKSREYSSAVDSTISHSIPRYTYRIVHVYPHDQNAFTQGLAFENGFLYEGTGLYGHSTLRRVELVTGNILQECSIPDQFFGEGITIYDDRIMQLTWQSRVGFVYDKASFELLRQFDYATEGWGITSDGKRLIMSDGSSTLYFLDPITFREVGRTEVSDNSGPVSRLNELEYVNGEIYANVWLTDFIARISPDTGNVIGWIDLHGLLTAEDRSGPVDVLNGIAYDARDNRLFVTGKLWPKVFEITLVPVN